MKKKNRNATDFEDHLAQELKDPEFKRLFDEAGKQLEISYQLLQLRKKKKISQKVLAKKIGTTQGNVARIESGQQNLTISMLNKLAVALGSELKVVLK